MQNNIGEARRSYAMTCENGKFSQEDAAAFFGVSLSAYQKWEQGNGKLNGAILGKIADKYGCSVDYLLCKTDNPTFIGKRTQILTTDERELVDIYRGLNAHGREQLLVFARGCAESYPKNTADSLGA